jgi:hypothetical protein
MKHSIVLYEHPYVVNPEFYEIKWRENILCLIIIESNSSSIFSNTVCGLDPQRVKVKINVRLRTRCACVHKQAQKFLGQKCAVMKV